MNRTRRILLAAVLTVGMAATRGRADGTNETDTIGPIPRFTIQADTNCVLDNRTGLMWARNANLPGTNVAWSEAIAFCKTLNYGGCTDWRLPSVNDLISLIDKRYKRPSLCNTVGTGQWTPGDPFKKIPEFDSRGTCYYWASTTTAGDPAGPWLVSMYYQAGSISQESSENTGTGYVWPVRSGPSGPAPAGK